MFNTLCWNIINAYEHLNNKTIAVFEAAHYSLQLISRQAKLSAHFGQHHAGNVWQVRWHSATPWRD